MHRKRFRPSASAFSCWIWFDHETSRAGPERCDLLAYSPTTRLAHHPDTCSRRRVKLLVTAFCLYGEDAKAEAEAEAEAAVFVARHLQTLLNGHSEPRVVVAMAGNASH